MNVETLRFILCALLMLLGLIFEISAVVGVFRFRYVLNRMHAAAMGDTMGVFLMLLGLAVANGINMLSLKLLVLVLLFWMASPVLEAWRAGATHSSSSSSAIVWRMSLPKEPSLLLRSRDWNNSTSWVIWLLSKGAQRKEFSDSWVKSVWGVDSSARAFRPMCST